MKNKEIHNLIQWAVHNRFDIEAQDGTQLVVVDYQELIKEIFKQLALSEKEEKYA
jgi:hypothetical protein